MDTTQTVDLTPSRESWPVLVQYLNIALESQRQNLDALERYCNETDENVPYIVEEAINEKIVRVEAAIRELETELNQPWALSVIEAE